VAIKTSTPSSGNKATKTTQHAYDEAPVKKKRKQEDPGNQGVESKVFNNTPSSSSPSPSSLSSSSSNSSVAPMTDIIPDDDIDVDMLAVLDEEEKKFIASSRQSTAKASKEEKKQSATAKTKSTTNTDKKQIVHEKLPKSPPVPPLLPDDQLRTALNASMDEYETKIPASFNARKRMERPLGEDPWMTNNKSRGIMIGHTVDYLTRARERMDMSWKTDDDDGEGEHQQPSTSSSSLDRMNTDDDDDNDDNDNDREDDRGWKKKKRHNKSQHWNQQDNDGDDDGSDSKFGSSSSSWKPKTNKKPWKPRIKRLLPYESPNDLCDKVPVLRAYGTDAITLDPVTIFIHGFRPYMYAQLPEDCKLAVTSEMVREKILEQTTGRPASSINDLSLSKKMCGELQMLLEARLQQEAQEAEIQKKLSAAYDGPKEDKKADAYVKYQPHSIVRVEIVLRTSIRGWHEKHERDYPMFKITVALPNVITSVRNMLRSKQNPLKFWNNLPRQFNVYECNIEFPLRFLVDKELRGSSSWLTLPANDIVFAVIRSARPFMASKSMSTTIRLVQRIRPRNHGRRLSSGEL
jgi:hypothetical protein